MKFIIYVFFIFVKSQSAYAAEIYGQYKSVNEIPTLVMKITQKVKSVSTLGTTEHCIKPSPPTTTVSSATKPSATFRPNSSRANSNSTFNLNINCSYPGVKTATFGGQLNLKINNGSVTEFSAKANGCQLNFKDFRQIQRNDGTIIMKNSKGCSVLIYPALRINNTQTNEYSFSVTNCTSTCGESISNLFWQAEINPQSNLCY